MQKKSSINRVLPLLNASLFALSGISYFDSGKNFLAYCCIVAGVIMLINLAITSPKFIAAIFIASAFIALLVAFDYWYSGKKYIQYAWLIVILVNLIAAYANYKKIKKNDSQTDQLH